MSYIAILSDVHGNLQALESVIKDMGNYDIQKMILLGDLIDYGQKSNEVITFFRYNCPYPIICNLWGNHEKSIVLQDYSLFSSARGVDCAKHTAKSLSDDTLEYLSTSLEKKCYAEFTINKMKCLTIHGSLDNPAWQGIYPSELQEFYFNNWDR